MTLFRNTSLVRVNGVDYDIGHIIRAETAYWSQWPDTHEHCLTAEFYEQYTRMRTEVPRWSGCRPHGGAPRESFRTYILGGRQVTGKVRLSDILCASAGDGRGACREARTPSELVRNSLTEDGVPVVC